MALALRMIRRVVGLLFSRLPELQLHTVVEPRDKRGRRWPLDTLLTSLFFGLVSGCKSLLQTEQLSATISGLFRKRFKLFRRTPDTTLRDLLLKFPASSLRPLLHRQVKLAHRRKAIPPEGLPFGVLSIDGKDTKISSWDDKYSQFVEHGKSAYGLVRTLTFCLVSCAARVCLDVIPIPPRTNEMGYFKTALLELLAVYGKMKLFQVISYDAGAASKENAELVKGVGLDYLFALNGFQPTLYEEALRVLGGLKAQVANGCNEEVRGAQVWVRHVYLTAEMEGYHEWDHLKTVVRVELEKQDKSGRVLERNNRYFLCSLAVERLSAKQWLKMVRSHWGVENGVHWTLDVPFGEDDFPWIKDDPQGMVAVLVLRRVAYNLVSLYRSVTQRSEEARKAAWAALLSWIREVIVNAREEEVRGIRERKVAMVLS